jgi:hypothetical protein
LKTKLNNGKKLFFNLLSAAAFIVVFLLFFPDAAYAYLDPGTGNVLLYLAVSLCGVLAYSAKSVFWAIFNKKKEKPGELDHDKISIFCEGKNYWNTFRPIVASLIEKQIPFSYFSMDIDDPGLEIENNLMFSRYIGEGSAAFARMGQVRSSVMLSTTPNIGTPGFPMPRPKYVKRLVHVCHGVDDIGLYKKGSLDHYDSVLLVGNFMIHGIRFVEHARGLREKELVPAGLPYLDDLASRMKNPLPPTDGKTVLVAPSWGTKGCLHVYGGGFIGDLARAGFNVILRPHPHSWKMEKNLLNKVKRELSDYDNVEWDSAPDGALAMERADILISDTSNIRMDYALLYERPVITLKIALDDPETFELSDMDSAWMETAEREIGAVVDKDSISGIVNIVRESLTNHTKKDLTSFRDENVFNFGSSGRVIAEYLSGCVSFEPNAGE